MEWSASWNSAPSVNLHVQMAPENSSSTSCFEAQSTAVSGMEKANTAFSAMSVSELYVRASRVNVS